MNPVETLQARRGMRVWHQIQTAALLLGLGAACAGDPLNGASQTVDLQVSQSVTNASPPENGLTSFVVQALNNSPISVPDVIGGDTLSAGLEYVSHTTGAKGSYDPASRIWTIGNLAPNEEVSLTVVARARAETEGSQQFNVVGVIPSRAGFTDSDLSNNISTAQVSVGAPLPPTAFLNEPPGFVPLTNRFWSQLTGDGWSYSGASGTTGNYQSIETLTGEHVPPVGGPTVLRGLYQEGTGNGTGTGRSFYTISGAVHEELFVGLWTKYDADFVGSTISTKMFFFIFGAQRSFLQFRERQEETPSRVYFMQFDGWVSPTGEGESIARVWFNPLVLIPYGEWHKLEFYFKKNTNTETADGIVRVWMNGVLYIEITNAILPGNITSFYHEGTHSISGGASTFPRDMAWYVAQTYISAPPR